MQKYQIHFNMKTSLIMMAVINTIYKITANTAKKIDAGIVWPIYKWRV